MVKLMGDKMKTYYVKTNCINYLGHKSTGGILLSADNVEHVKQLVRERFPKHYEIREIILEK